MTVGTDNPKNFTRYNVAMFVLLPLLQIFTFEVWVKRPEVVASEVPLSFIKLFKSASAVNFSLWTSVSSGQLIASSFISSSSALEHYRY